MSVYPKGILSREKLLLDVRDLFNEKGIDLTLGNVANLLNITTGKLTYYFPTKDHLFVAIADDYELKLAELRSRPQEKNYSLETVYAAVTSVMDLQYDYRCAIRYVSSQISSNSELYCHLLNRYRTNREHLRFSVTALTENGELKPAILEQANYRIFLFSYTNLLTTWLMNLEIYDIDKPYMEMKPIYLQGIFSVYQPYLTAKGKRALRKAGLEIS